MNMRCTSSTNRLISSKLASVLVFREWESNHSLLQLEECSMELTVAMEVRSLWQAGSMRMARQFTSILGLICTNQ